jgi:hypothetical protein
MKCDRPKTKLELFFKFFKAFFKYLDQNKLEAVIFFIGIAGAMILSATTLNLNKIKAIVEILK